MEQLPIYINIAFIITTLISLVILYKGINNSKPVIIGLILWLALQAVISLNGFYTVTTDTPPRFALLLIPPVILIAILFITATGRKAMAGFNIKTLVLIHVARIPVELTLYWLYTHKMLPEVMTFEGRNFDILCGLTAPFIYYFGYVKKVLSNKVLLAWNVACLLLLANIVFTAVLSAPFSFQQFGFEQPNIALLYFPFVWLPGFVVPAVLIAHLVTIKRLLKN